VIYMATASYSCSTCTSTTLAFCQSDSSSDLTRTVCSTGIAFFRESKLTSVVEWSLLDFRARCTQQFLRNRKLVYDQIDSCIFVGDCSECSDGVLRQSSRARYESRSSSDAFIISPQAVFTAFSAFPLLWG